MKILVVDDDNDSRVYLEKGLISQGHNIKTACNGKDALDSARDWGPDLIITDIMMPEMDGFELCRKIREDATLFKIPVIVYTATYVDSRDEKLAFSLGASRFIIKPMDLSDIIGIINDVMEETESQQLPETANAVEDKQKIEEEYHKALARKLDKKVRELEEEHCALQESEKKFRRLVETLRKDYFFFTRNEQGTFTYISPSITNVLGYSREEFCAHYTEYLTDNPINRNFGWYTELVLKGETLPPFEIEVLHKDGPVKALIVSEIPLFDKQGKVSGFDSIVHDITSRKKVEAKLRDYSEHLEGKIKERTRELEKKNEELERFNKLFVGREFRIKELKERLKDLEGKLRDKG